MTAPIPAARLAELRRIAAYEENCNPNPEDLAVLIGEIDRLNKTRDVWEVLQADYRKAIERVTTERDNWQRIAEAEHALRGEQQAENAELHRQLGVINSRPDVRRLVATLQRLTAQPTTADAYGSMLAETIRHVAGQIAQGLGVGTEDAQRGQWRWRQRLGAASAQSEPPEPAPGPQRAAEGFEWEYGYQNMDRKIDKTPMMIGRSLEDIGNAMQRHREYAPEMHYALRRRQVGPWETTEDESVLPGDLSGELDDLSQAQLAELKRVSGLPAPTDGRLYADGPPCRHDATWLVATDTGLQCMVCGPAEGFEVWDEARTEWCHGSRTATGGGIVIWPASTEAIARREVARLRMNPRKGTHYAVLRRQIGPTIEDAGPIAPEDEGIASADVHAQIAADNESEQQ